jgi:hypothetical protein
MEITAAQVKALRDATGAGMMDCRNALREAGGDLEKAEAALRTKGIASAGKKASRATKEGIVAAYIHLQGKVGVPGPDPVPVDEQAPERRQDEHGEDAVQDRGTADGDRHPVHGEEQAGGTGPPDPRRPRHPRPLFVRLPRRSAS